MKNMNHIGERNPIYLMKEADRLIKLATASAMRDTDLGRFDEAVSWIEFAATVGWRNHPGYFNHPGLEKTIRKLGHMGPLQSSEPLCKEKQNSDDSQGRILHVMTVAYAIGGHTRAVANWIGNCSETDSETRHSILLTAQGSKKLPDWLESAPNMTGGTCAVLDSRISALEKARTLRSIAHREADLVILHIHPNDPLPGIAFSDQERRFPVLFFNHADHVFSIGQSVADLVLDFRKSGQEVSMHERDCEARSRLVPIPMKRPEGPSFEDVRERDSLREKARETLEIPLEAAVALTIGDEYKYKPALGYDFRRMVRRILSEISNAHIYAIGIPNRGPWKDLSDDFDGRFHPVGEMRDRRKVYEYCAASDLYIEGYPFSSITAMLEAGLFALPIQRITNCHAPILSGDDVSLDDLVSPALNEGQYIESTMKMFKMPNLDRFKIGIDIRRSVLSNHCGPSWFRKWFEPVMNDAMALRRTSKERSVGGPFETIPEPTDSIRDCQLALTRSIHNPPETMILGGLNGVRSASLSILLELMGRSLARREPVKSPGEAALLWAAVAARYFFQGLDAARNWTKVGARMNDASDQ